MALQIVFEVNRSSYHAWRQRQGKTNLEGEALKVVLVKYHKASRGSAGARTLSEDLRGEGHQVGRYMASSLMKEAGIMCSHYEAPAQHRAAETFGVEPFEQGKLELYPGYIGLFIRRMEHVDAESPAPVEALSALVWTDSDLVQGHKKRSEYL